MKRENALSLAVLSLLTGSIATFVIRRRHYKGTTVVYYVDRQEVKQHHAEKNDMIEWRPWRVNPEGLPEGEAFCIEFEDTRVVGKMHRDKKTHIVRARLRKTITGENIQPFNYAVTDCSGKDHHDTFPCSIPVGRCVGC